MGDSAGASLSGELSVGALANGACIVIVPDVPALLNFAVDFD